MATAPKFYQQIETTRGSPIMIADLIRPGTVLLLARTENRMPAGARVKGYPFGIWRIADCPASELDRKTREFGWEFFFLAGLRSTAAWGRTRDSAVQRALGRLLSEVHADCFNAAEVAEVRCRKYLGLWRARIQVHARHLQRGNMLDDQRCDQY